MRIIILWDEDEKCGKLKNVSMRRKVNIKIILSAKGFDRIDWTQMHRVQ